MAVRDLELHGAVHKNGEEYYLIRDMVGMINLIVTLVNELRADHATFKTLTDADSGKFDDGTPA